MRLMIRLTKKQYIRLSFILKIPVILDKNSIINTTYYEKEIKLYTIN